MKTKAITTIMITLFLASMAFNIVPVAANAEDYELGPFEYAWTWVQDYVGWGPAEYYGESVTVVYEALNTWKVEVKQGEIVKQELEQIGTATVYRLGTDEVLDEGLEFWVEELLYDEGMDGIIISGSLDPASTYVWIYPDWSLWSYPYLPGLEFFENHWVIDDVYDYIFRIVDGEVDEWSYTVGTPEPP